jgi:hypothetical protein
LKRAKYWYEQAKAGLSGGDKLEAATRINKIDEQLKPLLAAVSKEPPAVANPNSKNPPPKKTSDTVVRKNFNTLRNEATLKSQWKIDGTSRVDPAGLRLLANPVSMASSFQLVDNWKVEIVLSHDGRSVEIEVNGELISLQPTRSPSYIVVERKGKKLGFALNTGYSSTSRMDVRALVGDEKLGPSTMLIRMSGLPYPNRKEDGVLFLSISVSGVVKVEE